MASLSLILQNNPQISFKEPDRLYYNQFLTKLVFSDKNFSYSTIRHIVTGLPNPWLQSKWSPIEFKELVKFRREGHTFAIFVNDRASAERLIDHVNKYCDRLNNTGIEDLLVAVEFPLTSAREQHLADGKIFRSKNFKYQYRVAITDGLMKRHKAAVKELLKSIDEDQENFQCNNGMLHRLRAFSYLYNNYYYCNDLGHITWLKLLDPDFIKKIQTIVQKT
jgi:hypothetical protein